MYRKRLSLLFFILCFTSLAYSQGKSVKEAFSKYHSGDYQAAIKLYRARLAQKPSLYESFMLGMCYVKTDSVPQAVQAFNEVLNSGNERINDNIKVQACDELARLYFRERNYRQALNYYQLYATIFEKARFNDVNWARFHFFNSNDQARCFAEIGKTDSAINVMTSYMFFTYKNLYQGVFIPENYSNSKDSLQHDSISRFYLSLLQKKFSKKKIKAELKKARDSFTFKEDRKPVDQHGFIWENIKCTVDFYGQHVVLVDRGIGNSEKALLEEIKSPFYTKTYQLEYFLQLPICKMISALPK